MVYLLKMNALQGVYYKVGFTADADTVKRFRSYGTDNPLAVCLQTVRTYSKTGRKLETALHAEIRAQGYSFVNANINGAKTEWFAMTYEQSELFEQNGGLASFKACKGRKIDTYTAGL